MPSTETFQKMLSGAERSFQQTRPDLAPEKKKMFLSRRELRIFETLYQGLKHYPGWRMQNIFNDRTREHYAIYEQCATELALAANRKRTLINVANHEAGHAVVMAAVHWKIGEAVLENNNAHGGYSGYVKTQGYEELNDYEPIENAPMPKKARIFSTMLANVSGFAAEHLFARLSHSYHEKLISYCQCRFLDERDSARALTNWHYFMVWCKQILLRNQQIYHVVVKDLIDNKVMTEATKHRLHNEVKKENVNKFYN